MGSWYGPAASILQRYGGARHPHKTGVSNEHERSKQNEETKTTSVADLDMKLEVVVIPVSDVERAKEFYLKLGWRLDADFDSDKDFRVLQFTPPGSGCSIIFGKNVTAAAPGSVQGLYLIVSDIEATRAELLGRGVEINEVFHDAGSVYAGPDEPYLFRRQRAAVGTQSIAATTRSPHSMIQTATVGCSRRLRRGCPGASTQQQRPSHRRAIWRAHFAAPRPRTESTRSASAGQMRTGPTGTPTIWWRSRAERSFRHNRAFRRHQPQC